MSTRAAPSESGPEQFLVDVTTELTEETACDRWRDVNVVLRLATVSGSQMHLDPSLELLCDSAQKMIDADLCHIYFWSERSDRPQLRLCRSHESSTCEHHDRVSRFNVWAVQHGKPLI